MCRKRSRFSPIFAVILTSTFFLKEQFFFLHEFVAWRWELGHSVTSAFVRSGTEYGVRRYGVQSLFQFIPNVKGYWDQGSNHVVMNLVLCHTGTCSCPLVFSKRKLQCHNIKKKTSYAIVCFSFWANSLDEFSTVHNGLIVYTHKTFFFPMSKTVYCLLSSVHWFSSHRVLSFIVS